jgi:hypothetical protein
VREEKRLRGGGFGILLVSELVDELVYNERQMGVMVPIICTKSDRSVVRIKRCVSNPIPFV